MHSKMAADKAKSHGLSATALLEETLQSITYSLTYLLVYTVDDLITWLFFGSRLDLATVLY